MYSASSWAKTCYAGNGHFLCLTHAMFLRNVFISFSWKYYFRSTRLMNKPNIDSAIFRSIVRASTFLCRWVQDNVHSYFSLITLIYFTWYLWPFRFEVSKVVWDLLLTKCTELRHLKHKYGPFSSKRSSGRYRPYSNVDSFLKVMHHFHLYPHICNSVFT